MKIMVFIFFTIGFLCLSSVIGFILKHALGLWFEEDFVFNFVLKSFEVYCKGIILVISILFIWIVAIILQSLFS